MTIPTFRFTFKHANLSQRDLIHFWLSQDYIAEWIHGAGLKSTLRGLEKFLHHQSTNTSPNTPFDLTQHWIGYDGNIPFVYMLTSNLSKSENNEYTKYSEKEGSAITLDIFIGETEYIGKGLAGVIIPEFLLSHFADVAEVFIDPEKSNERAVHVYQKLGFKIVGDFIAAWHPVPHHIMKLNLDDLIHSKT